MWGGACCVCMCVFLCACRERQRMFKKRDKMSEMMPLGQSKGFERKQQATSNTHWQPSVSTKHSKTQLPATSHRGFSIRLCPSMHAERGRWHNCFCLCVVESFCIIQNILPLGVLPECNECNLQIVRPPVELNCSESQFRFFKQKFKRRRSTSQPGFLLRS